jgi:hypothetical protein
MYTDKLGAPAAHSKPGLDPFLAAMVLAAMEDRKYLDAMSLAERERTVNALRDLERLRHYGEGQRRDAVVDRLARYVSRYWKPMGVVRATLHERARLDGESVAGAKHKASLAGVWGALTEMGMVQKIDLGRERATVVVEGDALVLIRSGGVLDGNAGIATHGLSRQISLPRSAVEAAFMSSAQWPHHVKDHVWAAFVGSTCPVDLRAERRLHWLRRRAIHHAEDWLVDAHSPHRSGTLDRTESAIADQSPTPLDALEAAEHHAEQLRYVYDLATPRLRRTLDVLGGLLTSGLDLPDAKRLAAQELGVKVGAIDTQLSRLRVRIRDAGGL